MNYQLLCWNLSLFLWFPWTETGIYQPFPSHQLTAQLQPWLAQWWEVGSNCLKQENREPGLWGAQHPQVSGRNRILKFTGVEACNMRNSVLQKVLQKYWAICSPFSSIMWKFKSYLFEAVSLCVPCFGFSPFRSIFPLIISFPFNLILSLPPSFYFFFSMSTAGDWAVGWQQLIGQFYPLTQCLLWLWLR